MYVKLDKSLGVYTSRVGFQTTVKPSCISNGDYLREDLGKQSINRCSSLRSTGNRQISNLLTSIKDGVGITRLCKG